MGGLAVPHFSLEQYLAAERVAEFPSEYVDGEIFPVQASSKAHGRISTQVGHALVERLKGGSCWTGNQVSVRVSPSKYFLPDLVVVCGGGGSDENGDAITEPKVIVEVLSPATEAYDRGDKFGFYRAIPSLAEYVLIAQHARRVEVFTRTPENDWLLRVYQGLEAHADLRSLGVSLPLAEVYAGLPEPLSV